MGILRCRGCTRIGQVILNFTFEGYLVQLQKHEDNDSTYEELMFLGLEALLET